YETTGQARHFAQRRSSVPRHLYAHKPGRSAISISFLKETIEMRNHPGKIHLRLKKEVNIGSGNHRGNSAERWGREEHNRDAPRGGLSREGQKSPGCRRRWSEHPHP